MVDKEKFKQLPYAEQLKFLMKKAKAKKDTKMVLLLEKEMKALKPKPKPKPKVELTKIIPKTIKTEKPKPEPKEEQSTYELLMEVEELLIRAGMYKPRKLPSR